MDAIDFFSVYIMGSVQQLLGFYFYGRLLHKKIRYYFYILFALCVAVTISMGPNGTMAQFGVFVLLLTASGIFICRSDWKPAILYASLVVEIMQLCYGIINCLLSISYLWMHVFDSKAAGLIFMLSGNILSLLLTGICCYVVWRYILCDQAQEKQYVFLILTPILMIFLMEEYINTVVYGREVVIGSNGSTEHMMNHYQILVIQLLGMASLFCILFAYKKLLQSFRLSTELTLLEQEEHSLNQYVEEAQARYEKTKAFRHDVRNHIAVIKSLLQGNKAEQALGYVEDLADLAEGLSFPCSTNNPVVDVLAGNKLGIAKSMGIHVNCSLLLPYPCGVRDIDLCIILSNALDNAICACRKVEEGQEKYIRVTGRLQGDLLFLEIVNSCNKITAFQKGTGLSNIKAVVEKYQGAMSVKAQRGEFMFHALLIIPG
ncbi:MAG: GHKL domain-containing protein [Lachnospiraceae bacterium]|jgi:hypothetical protein|nr:GHKL domain-containing protein [Lachnospiraceae bacterium]MCI8995584.1 GHKL domain-containing protein [Lachnospiraceae bacterium]MCI9132957.1 GHKL domain-containing protein [Lachnospiraceae bacterium]